MINVLTPEQIGLNLRALREANGMKGTDLARQIRGRGVEVPDQAVTRTEKNLRPLSFQEALAIADALGVDLADLADPSRARRARAEAKLAEARQAALKAAQELAEQEAALAALDGRLI